jgi:hypothetical protein
MCTSVEVSKIRRLKIVGKVEVEHAYAFRHLKSKPLLQ